jgi:hypothetical protein
MAITRENVIKEIEKLIDNVRVKGGKGSARFTYGLIEGFHSDGYISQEEFIGYEAQLQQIYQEL